VNLTNKISVEDAEIAACAAANNHTFNRTQLDEILRVYPVVIGFLRYRKETMLTKFLSDELVELKETLQRGHIKGAYVNPLHPSNRCSHR
jgi:hypothetical protein